LAELAAGAGAAIDVAVVSYGADASGRVELRTSLEGAAEDHKVIGHAELAAAALRVEEVIEQVSNGIGGLIEINRKKPVFVQSEPAFPGGAAEALTAAGELTSLWQAMRLGKPGLTIVLHLSGGCFPAEELEQALSPLRKPGMEQPHLYHLVLTESPHRSLAYPADAAAIEDPTLRRLWGLSSPLLGRQELAAKRPAVSGQSRGFVVNGRFDLLVEGIRLALAGSETRTDCRAP